MKKSFTRVLCNLLHAFSSYIINKKRVALVYGLLIIIALPVFAQSNIDVISLKNGSILKGIITEQIIGKSVKLETRDGNIFVFKIEEIEKITKESADWGESLIDVVHTTSGNVIKGSIVEQIIGESIKLETKDGNIFIFKMEDVDKITREPIVQQNVLNEKTPIGEKENVDQINEVKTQPNETSPPANSIWLNYYYNPYKNYSSSHVAFLCYERRFGRYFALAGGIYYYNLTEEQTTDPFLNEQENNNDSGVLPEVSIRLHIISENLFTLSCGLGIFEGLSVIPQFQISRNFGVGIVITYSWMYNLDLFHQESGFMVGGRLDFRF